MFAAIYDLAVLRTDLWRPGADHDWDAVMLHLARPTRAALRVELAGRGRLLVRHRGEVILLALVHPGWVGVDFIRHAPYRSPIPPPRADEARRIAAAGSGAARWAHRFAGDLAGGDGPLYPGRWLLSRTATHLWTRDGWDSAVVTDHPAGYLDWYAGDGIGVLLPLRRLSGRDDARVKAYRRQARDGTLPPVLLWWVSGLASYVLLDGHDRLVAALAEDREPPLLALASDDPQRSGAEIGAAVARYEENAPQVARHHPDGLAPLGRAFARSLHRIQLAGGRTRAWPVPGGEAGWQVTAERLVPSWRRDTAGA